jgi:hypothetical protein
MPANNRRQTKRRPTGKGSHGQAHPMVGWLLALIAIGALLAFLKVNNITSIEAGIEYFRGLSNDTSQSLRAAGVDKDISNAQICNFVDDPSCLYTHDNQQKIGDVNGDGVIDDKDSSEYANAHDATANDKNQITSNKADQLIVSEASKDTYKASEWPHWKMISGQCDARELVMRTAGFTTDDKCRPISGSAKDAYTGDVIKDIGSSTVIPIIPLEYVQQHGGSSWSTEQRASYANDQSILSVVSSSTSGDRGSKGPTAWRPKNKALSCTYVSRWVDTALSYHISVTQRDQQTLKTVLSSCSS